MKCNQKGNYNKQPSKKCKKVTQSFVPLLSEGGLPSPGGKRPDTELGRKEYEIIFFLAWFQYLDDDLMSWNGVNPFFNRTEFSGDLDGS